MSLSAANLMMTSDRRMLAALRCVNSITQLPLQEPLQLSAPGCRFIRNRSGDYVLLSAPGFETYSQTFNLDDLATIPALTTVDVTIIESSGHYLPQTFSLPLPRNLDITAQDSLFKPQIIALYPSPVSTKSPGWAVLRATIVNAVTGNRLPWSLIEAIPQGAQAAGLSPTITQADWRGEAFIVIPDIPVTTWSTGDDSEDDNAPVTTQEIDVQINVLFDAGNVTPIAENDRLIENPNEDYLPNPERLLASRGSLSTGSQTLSIASGRDRSLRLAVNLTTP